MNGNRIQNWEGSIISYPRAIVRPRNVDEIVAIMKDTSKYPSPLRAVGSNHSTTRCGVADEGTLVEMASMNSILEIGDDTVTAEAGALYIDVALQLKEHDLQFYVNVELGNLSIGSAACGGTKDASMPGEFGQVCSYAVTIRLVTPSGELLEVTEDTPELLQVMRSSYGLLGIIYEVVFKVQPIRPMSVEHRTYSLDQFEAQLPALASEGDSMMLYVLPFLNSLTVEFRRYKTGDISRSRFVWRFRNWVWSKFAPSFSNLVTRLVFVKGIRYFMIDRFNQVMQFVLHRILRNKRTVPSDQLIRYPAKGGFSKYTFSIWAFPEETYTRILRDYFAFVRSYYRRTGYRCNMMNVGYRINADKSSLFSYSFEGTVLTIDPVSTGNPGWEEFLVAYNEFCSQNAGIPLFNQTKSLVNRQANKAFGDRLNTFVEYRRRYDPSNRLLNKYFEGMFEELS